MAGVLDSIVWQVFWTLQCGSSFGLYSVADLLDSTVWADLWQVFWTVQCVRSFGLYSWADLLDCTVWAGLLDSSMAGSASRLSAVTG